MTAARRSLASIGLVLVAVGLLALMALGAEPSAIPAELLESGDLRSDGEGPGLIGNPLLILAAVVAVGCLTALVTFLIVRLTRRD